MSTRQELPLPNGLSDLLLIRTSTYGRDAARRIMEQAEVVVATLVADGFTPDNALRVYNAIGVELRIDVTEAADTGYTDRHPPGVGVPA